MKHILLLLLLPLCAAAQVTLQPWTQVYGTTPGQALGRYVNGITPSVNLPYKASISSFGNTGLYTLQTQNDTGAQRFFFGSNMLTGDLNGDGRKDIILRKLGGSSNMDTIVIYWGTSTGIDTLLPTKLHGLLPQDGFGASMCIGNLIGDSTLDLVIGSPQYPPSPVIQGRVYIYQGGNPFDTIPAVTLNGDSARYTLGIACAIGDLNNDGYGDIVVRGVHQTTPRYDYLDIWFGGDSFDTTKDVRLFGSEILARGLACFDANGDGVDDLLWTNRDTSGGISDWVYVHYGGSAFSTSPNLRLRDPGFALFGTSIVNGGDMNGDGYNDILVGAYFSNNQGFVYVYGGGPRIDERYDAAVGMTSLSYFGFSISGLGDVTGDGLTDIIVGAPNYEFGSQKGYWGIFKGDTSIIVTDVRESPTKPQQFTLHDAYPNPFNPQTTIRYDLQRGAQVTLEVFDILGKRVALLVESFQEAGAYQETFYGAQLASGIYYYRFTARTQQGNIYTDTKKLTLIK